MLRYSTYYNWNSYNYGEYDIELDPFYENEKETHTTTDTASTLSSRNKAQHHGASLCPILLPRLPKVYCLDQ